MSVINCDAYDYLEIACLYRYQVELELLNGQILCGMALNVGVVVLEDIKQECLLVELNENQQRWLPTKELISLRVLNSHAKFEFVRFKAI